MAWHDIFSQFGKKEVIPELVRDKDESFARQDLPDALITNAAGGYQQTVINFDPSIIDETQKINNWRMLAQCPEISWAVTEVCNDAIITDYETYSCQLTFDEESTLPDKIKDSLALEFRTVLKLLNFKRNGNELFKQWYVDGKVYYHGILDPNNPKAGLTGIRWIDPRSIKRVVEMTEIEDNQGFKFPTVAADYYIYTGTYGNKSSQSFMYSAGQANNVAIKVNPECVAYANSGIFYEKGEGTNFSLSYLDAALKPYNILTSLEQAMTIYRIARAPEKRVFYVDVGNLQKDKADQYLQNVMNRFKRKLTFNSSTGTVSSENNEMGIMDDFWLPRKEGGRGTEVTTLTSGTSWSDMNDLEWFQKKVLRGLNIPYGRYQSDNLFSSGRSMEITREEVKFAKFISSLRSKYGQSLIQLLKIQVVAKNILTIEEFEMVINELNVKWKTDAYWEELIFNEMWQTRLQLIEQFGSSIGKHVSHAWIQRNVLQQTEEESKEMRKEIEAELKDKIFNPPEPDEE